MGFEFQSCAVQAQCDLGAVATWSYFKNYFEQTQISLNKPPGCSHESDRPAGFPYVHVPLLLKVLETEFRELTCYPSLKSFSSLFVILLIFGLVCKHCYCYTHLELGKKSKQEFLCTELQRVFHRGSSFWVLFLRLLSGSLWVAVIEDEVFSENQRNKCRKQHFKKPKRAFSTCAHISENGEGVIQAQGNSWSPNSWSDSALPEQLVLISWSLYSSLWVGHESFSQVVDELSHHSFTILPCVYEAVQEWKRSCPYLQWCGCVLRAPWLLQCPINLKKKSFLLQTI